MDNLIDFKSHDKSNDKKFVLQQNLANDELGSNTLSEGQLYNNLSKDNEECEVDNSLIDKISPVLNINGINCKEDEQCQEKFDLKTNQTSVYNENSQQTVDTITDANNTSSVDAKKLNCFENGSVDTISINKVGSLGAKLPSCIHDCSSEAVEMNYNSSSTPSDDTPFEELTGLEKLLVPVISPHIGNTNINPSRKELNVMQEKFSRLYGRPAHDRKIDSGLVSLETDKSLVISNNNAIPQAESIVSSNFSLNLLKSYDSDESSDGEACEVSLQYREDKNEEEDSDKDSDSDSSSSSSSTSIIVSDSSESESDELYENFTTKAPKPIKARKELDLEDLPPIEDLKISVPEEDCTPIGKVFQIIDRLVVVQAFKDIPAYNLDTVLFMEGGQPLGKVFDVFGPVTEPFYCIRFNSRDHIEEKKICVDQMVYCAPKTKYTNYVFLAQLMKLKGSDASWEDDNEPPEIYLEYSDDEQEQRAKKKKSRSRNRKAVFRVDADPDEPARKKHFAYEKRMNELNLQLTAVRNNQNGGRNRTQGFNNLWSPAVAPPGPSPSHPTRDSVFREVSHQMFGRSPMFGDRLPPRNVPFGDRVPPRNAAFPFSPQPETPRPVNSCNLLRTPPPCSSNPNTSFFSEYRPDTSSGLPNTSSQAFSFGSTCPLNNSPRWLPPLPPWYDNTLGNPLYARRNSSVTNNNPLPSSPYWNQRPQPSPQVSTFSALPNSPFVPPPQPFWPTQSPPQSRNASFSNPSHIHFNPNLPPPPSPSHFNR